MLAAGIVENGAERFGVDFDAARAGSAADRPSGIVKLDRVSHVPRQTIIAREDEVDFFAAETRADDLRRQKIAVFQRNQLVPPSLRRHIGKRLDRLPGLAAVGRAQSFAADQRSLGGFDDRNKSVVSPVAKRFFLAGLGIVNDRAIRQREHPSIDCEFQNRVTNDAVDSGILVLCEFRGLAPGDAVVSADGKGDVAGFAFLIGLEPDVPGVQQAAVGQGRQRAGVDVCVDGMRERYRLRPGLAAVGRARDQIGFVFVFAEDSDQRTFFADAQGRVDMPGNVGCDANGRRQTGGVHRLADGQKQETCKDGKMVHGTAPDRHGKLELSGPRAKGTLLGYNTAAKA